MNLFILSMRTSLVYPFRERMASVGDLPWMGSMLSSSDAIGWVTGIVSSHCTTYFQRFFINTSTERKIPIQVHLEKSNRAHI